MLAIYTAFLLILVTIPLTKEINNIWNYQLAVSIEEPNFLDFLKYIAHYQQFKERQWESLDNADRLSEILSDKLDTIRVIYESLTSACSTRGLKEKVDSLFSNSEHYITLCTVHRAKGLEAERVFILKPDDMPLTYKKQQPWEYQQELNLLYVALTRSKSELYIMGKASWLCEGKSTWGSDTISVTNKVTSQKE